MAQLDRATDYGSVGWEFESLRAHHNLDHYGEMAELAEGDRLLSD